MQDYRQQIIDSATTVGVPPAIALAVAERESGTQQFKADGSLVTGRAGEIGIFQLMPATAAQLGVDPSDAAQNIGGGVSYLKRMYQMFGDWKLAVAAYEAGPRRVQKYVNGDQSAVPLSSWAYADWVIGMSAVNQAALNLTAAFTPSSAPTPTQQEYVDPYAMTGSLATPDPSAPDSNGMQSPWWIRFAPVALLVAGLWVVTE